MFDFLSGIHNKNLNYECDCDRQIIKMVNDYSEYKNRFGVDAIMVGRAAIGNPWIFQQIKDAFYGRESVIPGYEERVRTVIEQLEIAAEMKGERRAVCEMRSQYAGYFKGLYNFKPVRMNLMNATTIEECKAILRTYHTDI